MIKDEIKLLALDLDGTVLRTDGTLSPEVELALKKAAASGIEIVAASGRPYGSMPKNVLEIEGVNYCVVSNGAAVYDREGRRIHSELLDEKSVLALLEITKDEDLIFEAFIDGLTYTDLRYINDPMKYGCSKAYVDYVRAAHGHIEDMRGFIFEHRSELDGLEYVCTDKLKRERIRQKIADNIRNLYITSSSRDFVEFSAKSATKANGVKYVSKLLNIAQKNCAACGNADNDADMIKWAGLGAAVKNASPMCVECADIVVASNDDDGVAQLIKLISNE